jgi:hypothetical protein
MLEIPAGNDMALLVSCYMKDFCNYFLQLPTEVDSVGKKLTHNSQGREFNSVNALRSLDEYLRPNSTKLFCIKRIKYFLKLNMVKLIDSVRKNRTK